MSPDDTFRADFARLVRALLEETDEDGGGVPISRPIQAHLGSSGAELEVFGEELPAFELANLQRGLDAALARPGFTTQTIGVTGQSRRYSDVSLSDLLTTTHLTVGPPEYVNAPVGPNRTLPCLAWAVLLVASPEGPICLFVRRGEEHGPAPGLTLQAIGRSGEAAQRLLADIRSLMAELDVFRGQVITIEADRYGRSRVEFLERPVIAESELVLPDGVLGRIERHVVGPTRHREALVARGQHLARGLLLWGPPGTGKTHTVRFLTGRLTDTTVIILSGASLGLVGAFGNLARRLTPAVVVLEDVDLVAQERTFGPGGSSPVLFELMNEMSGLAADADVAFVLTTNRPDALEPALAARPGRVDLAIEIPLPDRQARRALVELYSRELDLPTGVLDEVVSRAEGATASFFRELFRKAMLLAAEAGRNTAAEDDVRPALDDLLDEAASLTRVLLGSEPASDPASPWPHGWMRGMARLD